MLSHRYYYAIKPYLPAWLRITIRRIRSQSILRAHRSIWPINEAASRMPSGWPGWPEGKQFAVVLTHDVEGPQGVSRCQKLAELEANMGFRSLFNFIPEGEYRDAPELRSWLVNHGFEVGVHDLKHDGRLYSSRDSFKQKAERINLYLKTWNATGFRSGFMLRNLEWMRDLDIDYDLSTFDTDPFEPQPEGAGTIFPFLVAPAQEHAGQVGFVELPYTLAQDSTLFMILREETNQIWKEKLDWIARMGGMALINVHPDYLQFQNRRGRGATVEEHYADLLRHLTENHRGKYWHALPREVSAFTRHWISRHSAQKTFPAK